MATQIWQHKPIVSKNWTNSKYDKLKEINKKTLHNKTSETKRHRNNTLSTWKNNTNQNSYEKPEGNGTFLYQNENKVKPESYISQKYASGMKGKPNILKWRKY